MGDLNKTDAIDKDRARGQELPALQITVAWKFFKNSAHYSFSMQKHNMAYFSELKPNSADFSESLPRCDGNVNSHSSPSRIIRSASAQPRTTYNICTIHTHTHTYMLYISEFLLSGNVNSRTSPSCLVWNPPPPNHIPLRH
jgi:hypothetical protein